MENDDLDVTKGCEIIVSISNKLEDLKLNSISHKPYILSSNNNQIEIYSGSGVGVVTKDGLKPPKNYPAINPKPLEVLETLYTSEKIDDLKLYCTVSVTNGEKIAKQTANSKVGVLGGISILGTTGFVKPISATAYIDSIEEELNYAKANNFDTIVFTLGNTAFKQSKQLDDSNYIIEIGNFIYDGIKLAADKRFKKIELWIGIGKTVKIAQGFKNTHNRFGGIDFDIVQTWCDVDITDCLTIKGVRELLGDEVDNFDKIIKEKATKQLNEWFDKDISINLI